MPPLILNFSSYKSRHFCVGFYNWNCENSKHRLNTNSCILFIFLLFVRIICINQAILTEMIPKKFDKKRIKKWRVYNKLDYLSFALLLLPSSLYTLQVSVYYTV